MTKTWTINSDIYRGDRVVGTYFDDGTDALAEIFGLGSDATGTFTVNGTITAVREVMACMSVTFTA